eukprot:CAMPEP_0179007960 /NCGR_PEP_ID=MMETSP0795-20121207/15444_1 /TAXON_ID=88552 /ORGANISM="Amoebophrya sp., Strain Ameob2" /LENGTH=302 /DNA_ID=CAMNT_0020702979 /DNA_START=167 /DNA_END=1074 /DNA_ORIENTATION=-
MAEVFDAIDAWEESMPWSEYRTEVLLFSEETTRDETKVVAHIILRGIKPHQPRWYKAANRMPQAWRVTKKDPTYKNATDPNDEIAIKYYTPVERFLAWMDRAEAYILMKRAPRLFDHISEHLHRIKMRLDQNPDNPIQFYSQTSSTGGRLGVRGMVSGGMRERIAGYVMKQKASALPRRDEARPHQNQAKDPPENGPEHTEPAGGGKAAAVLRARSAVSAEPVGAESARVPRRSGGTGEGSNTNVENAAGARHAMEGGNTAGRFEPQKVEGGRENRTSRIRNGTGQTCYAPDNPTTRTQWRK